MKNRILSTLALMAGIVLPCHLYADVTLGGKTNLKISLSEQEAEVVHTAFDMFSQDYRNVFGTAVTIGENPDIRIGTIGIDKALEAEVGNETVNKLRQRKEGFLIQVRGNRLYVLGSDKRGTAYGVLELSRMMGVSPWEWWADSPIKKQDKLVLKDGYIRMESPSVRVRGIFLNDEDFALVPWSEKTHEPSDVPGQIGPKTHARIFELLLRLRANTLWPAMHRSTVPFYLVPDNKEMADKYGILIGTSHCEPMARNTNGEWHTHGKGEYNFVTNRENVLKFWEERVQQQSESDNIYTLGMRGIHDGPMSGAKTPQEQKKVLTEVIKEQRKMLARHINPDVTKVPQVFIPYKEVLDAYNQGMKVPDDVTLMWCDDNYGYIRHFPTKQEQMRKGGNGIYYHVSYWGRPHDYLWLATNHPAQLYTQMKTAYDKGTRDMWILNVGDIKPAEYLTELFMDMAWNIDGIKSDQAGLEKHLSDWLTREFGAEYTDELTTILNEYYRLAYIHKPEFMGNTRTEEKDPKFKVVADLPWSETEIRQRLLAYESLTNRTVRIAAEIPAELQSTWFQLVEYPVRAAAEMNRKHLYAQLARHGLANWKYSDIAYERIVSLTERYNALNGGKWKGIMNFSPRGLAVYQKVPHTQINTPLPKQDTPLYLLDGKDYIHTKGESPVCYGLGYRRGAVHLAKGSTVIYQPEIEAKDSLVIEVCLAPNHPVEGNRLRYAISVDNGPEQIVDFSTKGRSEEWKLNVLYNQAIRRTIHAVKGTKKPEIKIKAIDEGVVVDQIKVRKYATGL